MNAIKVGSQFYTRIASAHYSLVEVIQDLKSGAKRYVCRRVDTGAILSRPRSAAALHDAPGPWSVPERKSIIPAGYTKGYTTAAPVINIPAPPLMPTDTPAHGVRKVASMSKAGATALSEVLALTDKYARLPEEGRKFLGELIEAAAKSVPPPAPATHVREIHKDR